MSWEDTWNSLIGKNTISDSKEKIDRNDKIPGRSNIVNSVNLFQERKNSDSPPRPPFPSAVPKEILEYSGPPYGEGPPYPDRNGMAKCFYCGNLAKSVCQVSGEPMSALSLLRQCSDFKMLKVGIN